MQGQFIPTYHFILSLNPFVIDLRNTFVKGVPAYRYEMSDDIFDGPEYNRQNWCFCPKGVDPKKCHGLLDMGECLAGVPFAMTLPHFLNSDRFLTGVQGLRPDREKHMGFFEIEKVIVEVFFQFT